MRVLKLKKIINEKPMDGINMIELNTNEIKSICGAGAWDNFWNMVGEMVGSSVASAAYSQESKTLHDIGGGKGSVSLDTYLNNQNDPLL